MPMGTRIDTQTHPIYFLHCRIPASEIDVNVHPQKREIRLKEEKKVKLLIHREVNSALSGQVSFKSEQEISPRVWQFREEGESSLMFREEISTPEEKGDLPLPLIPFCTVGLYSHYLLVSGCPHFPQEGITWVDLIRASALIRFEELCSQLEKEGKASSQILLFPRGLRFSPSESEKLVHHLPEIERVGIALRQIGENSFLMEGIPPFMEEEEAVETLQGWFCEIDEMEKQRLPLDERLRRLASLTCSSAKRGKKTFALNEAQAIFRELMQNKTPYFCPRGKKILFHMNRDGIEKNFQ